MKKTIQFVLAGVMGGVITLLGIQQGITPASKMENEAKVATSPRFVSNPLNASFDFRKAAKKATASVVYIQAQESDALASKKYRSRMHNPFEGTPFEQFFGQDFFGGPSYGAPLYKLKGAGSGVIISKDGYIVTNNHVVDFADEFEVTLSDGRKYNAKLIGKEPSADLAVIKIDAEDLPAVEYGNSDNVEVGQWVLAIGNPFGYLTSTATAGIVSAKGRDLGIIKGDRAIEQFIQTDAVINPGNSGGALLDVDGKLIGVNTAIATHTGYYNGYSFAIPVNLMRAIVDDIIKYGSYQRTSLGIYVMPIDDEIQQNLGLDSKNGVYIDELVQGGAAQFGGLLPSDVIIQIDRHEIKNIKDLHNAIALTRVGDVIQVTVVRNGAEKTIPVKLTKAL